MEPKLVAILVSVLLISASIPSVVIVPIILVKEEKLPSLEESSGSHGNLTANKIKSWNIYYVWSSHNRNLTFDERLSMDAFFYWTYRTSMVIGVLGIIGNSLTLLVLMQNKSSTFNQMLISLSVADNLVLVSRIAEMTLIDQGLEYKFSAWIAYLIYPLRLIFVCNICVAF